MYLYLKRIGTFNGRPQYEGICEEQDDLDAAEGTDKADFNGSKIDLAPGSLIFCNEDDSRNIKESDGTWHKVVTASEGGS